MGKSQRTKGAGFEREIVNVLRDAGIEADRNLSQTRDGGGDISLPGLLIECKRRAKISVYEWMDQAQAACEGEQRPVVVARADRRDAIVILPLDLFISLIGKKDA